MKRNIIILLALIVLFAMPVLAKPMVMVTNPLVDDGFMLQELDDEQLIKIEGNHTIIQFEQWTYDGDILHGEYNYDVIIHYYNNGNYAMIEFDGTIIIIDTRTGEIISETHETITVGKW